MGDRGAEFAQGRYAGDVGEVGPGLVQGVLGELPVVNVGIAAIPCQDVAGRIEQGKRPAEKPAVFAVEPPEPKHVLHGLSLSEAREPIAIRVRSVIWIDLPTPTGIQDLLLGHSDVLQISSVVVVHQAVGRALHILAGTASMVCLDPALCLLSRGDISITAPTTSTSPAEAVLRDDVNGI